MGWLTALLGTNVGLDTAPLIYFIEKNPKYLPVLDPFFREVSQGNIRVVTSVITLTEVLTQPFRLGDYTLVRRYTDILANSDNIVMLPISEAVALEAARVRADYGFRTPDALQVATARVAGAGTFLTNDASLLAKQALPTILLESLIGTP